MEPERPPSSEEQRITRATGKYRNTAYDKWWESPNPIFVARHQVFEPVLLADKRAYVRGLEMVCGRNIHPDELQAGDPKKHEKLKIEVIEILRKKDYLMLEALQKYYSENPLRMGPSIFQEREDTEKPPKKDIAEPRKFTGSEVEGFRETVMRSDNYRTKKVAEYINENRNNPWWESTNPVHYARHAMGLFTYMTHQHPMIQECDFDLLVTGVSMIIGGKVHPTEFSIHYNLLKDEVREKLEKWDEIAYRRMTRGKK